MVIKLNILSEKCKSGNLILVGDDHGHNTRSIGEIAFNSHRLELRTYSTKKPKYLGSKFYTKMIRSAFSQSVFSQ